MREEKTKSQWLSEPSPLDVIFADPSPFVESLNSIPDLVHRYNPESDMVRKLESGEADTVIAPKPLAQEVSKFIRIIHGPHNDDYVWHIEPASPRRPWRISEDRALYLIARVMNELLPDVNAKLWLPESGWELRTITFKALDLNNHWGFDHSIIPQINYKLFDVLNKVV